MKKFNELSYSERYGIRQQINDDIQSQIPENAIVYDSVQDFCNVKGIEYRPYYMDKYCGVDIPEDHDEEDDLDWIDDNIYKYYDVYPLRGVDEDTNHHQNGLIEFKFNEYEFIIKPYWSDDFEEFIGIPQAYIYNRLSYPDEDGNIEWIEIQYPDLMYNFFEGRCNLPEDMDGMEDVWRGKIQADKLYRGNIEDLLDLLNVDDVNELYDL